MKKGVVIYKCQEGNTSSYEQNTNRKKIKNDSTWNF